MTGLPAPSTALTNPTPPTPPSTPGSLAAFAGAQDGGAAAIGGVVAP